MSDPKKKCPTMTTLKVNIQLKTSSGYSEVGEFKSPNPTATKPPEPWETARAAAEQLARYAELGNDRGAQVVLAALDRAHSVFEWKIANGYEVTTDPRKVVLDALAADLGFQLVDNKN